MKKTLISIVLATFILGIPVASEARAPVTGDEIQAVATPGQTAPSFLQSVGIGRRRTIRRRRLVIRHRRTMRRVVRHRRVVRRRAIRRNNRLRIGIPRRVGVGVRRSRRY